MIQEIIDGKHETILNYNSNLSSRAGIRKIICLRRNADHVIVGFKRDGIDQLPKDYIHLEL